jgi:hypothetical protein
MQTQREKFTYANPVVNFYPQKNDLYMMDITAGGNLITFKGNASVHITNMDTAKMHWSSVISIQKSEIHVS